MAMTVEQLVAEARQLPRDQRAELLDRLGEIVHGEVPAGVAEAWNQLALERLASLESGRSKLVPGEDAMARMRERIGR